MAPNLLPSWPLRLALLALLAGLAALLRIAWVAGGGALVFPLDDAYIHLAVARHLTTDGTWGVNAGTFGNASSSPAWTLVLAGLFTVLPPSPVVAWALGALSAIGVLLVAAAGLRAAPIGPRSTAAVLLSLVIFAPLPFLAALGMEHTAHAGAALALLLAARSASATPALPIVLLTATATLLRYETALLVLPLAGVALLDRRPGRAAALLAGAGGAIGAFAAFSLAHGGAWAPNGVLKKANLGAWAGLRAAVTESPALGALLFVGIVAALRTRDPEDRRAVVVLVLTSALQLTLGRVGWLYRYEAWLLVLGIVVVAIALARLRARHPRLTVVLALLPIAPLTTRTWAATQAFGPSVRFCARADVDVARWLAARFPATPIAVHDLGAAAFYAVGPILDLGGLGDEVIARLHREGALTPARVAEALSRHEVRIAVTGFTWPADARPPTVTEAARLFVPYPAPPGEFGVVVWAVDPTLVPAITQALDTLPPGEGRWGAAGGPDLRVEEAALTGSAVEPTEGGISFYTNGTATLRAPWNGQLEVAARGSPAGGRLPRYTVEAGDARASLEADDGAQHPIGPVLKGETIRVTYGDDLVMDGEDRNLFLRRVTVVPTTTLAPMR